MACGDFKDLTRRTASDEILCDEAFNIAKNPRYYYQRGLTLIVYKFLIRKASGGAITNQIMYNKELGEELHKPVIRTLNNTHLL